MRAERDGANAALTSDAHLLELARGGDTDAYFELWGRHEEFARRSAGFLTRNEHDADDLVATARDRIWSAIGNGHGPTLAFRSYLATTLRNTATVLYRGAPVPQADPVAPDAAAPAARDVEAEVVMRSAFESLSARHQEVLTLTEVSEMTPAEVAGHLGMSPNSVAQLAHRARRALRYAWIDAHMAASASSDPTCRKVRHLIRRLVAGDATAAEEAQVDDHVEDCDTCRAAYVGALDAGVRRSVLAIAVLGIGAERWFTTAATTGATGAAGGTAATGASGGAATGSTSGAGAPGATGTAVAVQAGGALAAAAAVIALVAAVVWWPASGDGEPRSLRRDEPAVVADATADRDPSAPGPDPTDAPADPGAPDPTGPTTTAAADPTEPVDPADPTGPGTTRTPDTTDPTPPTTDPPPATEPPPTTEPALPDPEPAGAGSFARVETLAGRIGVAVASAVIAENGTLLGGCAPAATGPVVLQLDLPVTPTSSRQILTWSGVGDPDDTVTVNGRPVRPTAADEYVTAGGLRFWQFTAELPRAAGDTYEVAGLTTDVGPPYCPFSVVGGATLTSIYEHPSLPDRVVSFGSGLVPVVPDAPPALALLESPSVWFGPSPTGTGREIVVTALEGDADRSESEAVRWGDDVVEGSEGLFDRAFTVRRLPLPGTPAPRVTFTSGPVDLVFVTSVLVIADR